MITDIKTNPNLVVALGIYIKSKRLSKNIGLREMADILNISPAYLSNLESGKHNMTNPLLLKNIAKILEIDHLKLFKIIGYTDKDRKELKTEILNELLDESEYKEIAEIVKIIINMPKDKLELVRQYVELISKV